jgi:hypothetical protein
MGKWFIRDRLEKFDSLVMVLGPMGRELLLHSSWTWLKQKRSENGSA